MTRLDLVNTAARGEAVNWRWVFRPLVARRVDSLLPAAGLPDAIAVSPARMHRLAREFLRRELALPPRPARRQPDGSLRPDQQWRELVVTALERLEAEYGTDVAQRFCAWALRHEVERTERIRWFACTGAFQAFANQPERRPDPTQLTRPGSQILLETVSAHFGREAMERLEDQIAKAGAIPLTSDEAAFLSFDPGEDESAVRPADDVDFMAVAIYDEAAWRTWNELRARLAPADFTVFRAWAMEVAPECGT